MTRRRFTLLGRIALLVGAAIGIPQFFWGEAIAQYLGAPERFLRGLSIMILVALFAVAFSRFGIKEQ